MMNRTTVLPQDQIHVWHWRQPSTMCSRVVALGVLGHYAGRALAEIDLTRTHAGKPFLLPAVDVLPINFNISGSDDLTMLAVSHQPVGIDVERVQALPDLDDVAKYCFTLEEARQFAAIPPSDRAHYFYRSWTRKEAYLKACGCGLSIEPNRIDTTQATIMNTIGFAVSPTHRGWHLHDAKVRGGFQAALSTPICGARIVSRNVGDDATLSSEGCAGARRRKIDEWTNTKRDCKCYHFASGIAIQGE